MNKQQICSAKPVLKFGYFSAFRQRGSLILLCLVVISLLANISLLGMDNAIHSNRLTTSFMSSSIALQRAQRAINLAEVAIDLQAEFKVNSAFEPVSQGMFPQFYNSGSRLQSAWQHLLKNDLCFSNKHTVMQSLEVKPASKPNSLSTHKKLISAYMIEHLLSQRKTATSYYRVTACGVGLDGFTLAIVQTIIRYETSWQRVSWQQIR